MAPIDREHPTGDFGSEKYTQPAERRSREPQKIRNSSFYGFNGNKPSGDEHAYVLNQEIAFSSKSRNIFIWKNR